jgi:hypothetical protein
MIYLNQPEVIDYRLATFEAFDRDPNLASDAAVRKHKSRPMRQRTDSPVDWEQRIAKQLPTPYLYDRRIYIVRKERHIPLVRCIVLFG